MSASWKLAASEIAGGVASGKLAAPDVLEAHRAQIETWDPKVHALLGRGDEAAEKAARAKPAGPLAGVPFIAKDNICTRGLATTCGSRILGSYVPPYDATVISRLRAAGAVL